MASGGGVLNLCDALVFFQSYELIKTNLLHLPSGKGIWKHGKRFSFVFLMSQNNLSTLMRNVYVYCITAVSLILILSIIPSPSLVLKKTYTYYRIIEAVKCTGKEHFNAFYHSGRFV